MRLNNPLVAGLWEMEAIWPDASRPDVAVSVGTGFSRDVKGPNGFIWRAIRAFLHSPSLHGENGWMALINSLRDDERSNYFRFNFEFQSEEPELDDVSLIPDLREEVRLFMKIGYLNACRDALWASTFYFELDEQREYCLGAYKCKGSILSKTSANVGLLCDIKKTYPAAKFTLRHLNSEGSEVQLGELTGRNCCTRCGFFQKPVCFDVRHPDAVFQIEIMFDKVHRRQISGFPHSESWFETQQSLDSVFGRTDHQPERAPSRQFCCIRRDRKRQGSSLDGHESQRPRITKGT
jgi:hypothetical protein